MGMRPEQFAYLASRVARVERHFLSIVLTQIYTLIQTEAPDEALTGFSKFYQEALVGPELEDIERGVRPVTANQVIQKIKDLELSEPLERVCLALADMMKPPEPLEL